MGAGDLRYHDFPVDVGSRLIQRMRCLPLVLAALAGLMPATSAGARAGADCRGIDR